LYDSLLYPGLVLLKTWNLYRRVESLKEREQKLMTSVGNLRGGFKMMRFDL
jgi:hypothetical protein